MSKEASLWVVVQLSSIHSFIGPVTYLWSWSAMSSLFSETQSRYSLIASHVISINGWLVSHQFISFLNLDHSRCRILHLSLLICWKQGCFSLLLPIPCCFVFIIVLHNLACTTFPKVYTNSSLKFQLLQVLFVFFVNFFAFSDQLFVYARSVGISAFSKDFSDVSA